MSHTSDTHCIGLLQNLWTIVGIQGAEKGVRLQKGLRCQSIPIWMMTNKDDEEGCGRDGNRVWLSYHIVNLLDHYNMRIRANQ